MSSHTLSVGCFISQYPYSDQFESDSEYFCSGAERVANNLAESASENISMHVVTASADRQYDETVHNDITIHRSPALTTINTTQIAPTLLIDQLHEEFDIVHAHNSTPPGVIAAACYAAVHDVPLIITHHGGENYESHGGLVRRLGLALYTRVLIDRLFEYADIVVSPSSGYVSESRALSRLDGDIRTIPNGIDRTPYAIDCPKSAVKRQLGLDPSATTLLYLGSHHPRKGVSVLLEAVIDILEQHSARDIELVLAGSGQTTAALKDRVREAGVESAVTFPGFVPEAQKPQYMYAADIFILPSVTPAAEVYPLVILEAAAGGTPIVSSDFPTLRSIVEPNDIGRLVEPDDVTALSKTLRYLIDEPATRDRLASNALAFASEREWPRIATQYEQLYEELQ